MVLTLTRAQILIAAAITVAFVSLAWAAIELTAPAAAGVEFTALDNGRPALTHALLPGNPAIDGGNPAGCFGDDIVLLESNQRGFPRPANGDGVGEARCSSSARLNMNPGAMASSSK